MNTYEIKQTTYRNEQLAAFDLATDKIFPKELLTYVIGPYLPYKEEVVVETMTTVKMQPRYPVEELHAKCRQYGPCCICLFNTGSVCIPATSCLFHIPARSILTVGCTIFTSSFIITRAIVRGTAINCCEANIEVLTPLDERILDWYMSSWDCCPAEKMSCTQIDYRLKRPCLVDCCDLCVDCCCMGICDDRLNSNRNRKRVTHGPDEQWMV